MVCDSTKKGHLNTGVLFVNLIWRVSDRSFVSRPETEARQIPYSVGFGYDVDPSALSVEFDHAIYQSVDRVVIA